MRARERRGRVEWGLHHYNCTSRVIRIWYLLRHLLHASEKQPFALNLPKEGKFLLRNAKRSRNFGSIAMLDLHKMNRGA